jgi:hypothetical protein
MPRNLTQPSALVQPSTRLAWLAVARFVLTFVLTILDWFGFQFTCRPDVAPHLNDLNRTLLPILFVGMLATLMHLWALTFLTFRSAVRAHNIHERT